MRIEIKIIVLEINHVIMLRLLFLFIFIPYLNSAQIPFYYKLKNVSGTIYQSDGSSIQVRFKSRRQLEITGSKNRDVDTLLHTLTFTRTSRKYLEHLITTSAKVTLDVSDHIGIMLRDRKYRLIAGITGSDTAQSTKLIEETSNFSPANKRKKPHLVYEENKIELFKGSILFFYDSTISLSTDNVYLFDYKTNRRIFSFSMDTIKIEPIRHPDLMYKNFRELYYFAGVHEIHHTIPENIQRQIDEVDSEVDALSVERVLFRKRIKIANRIYR